MIDAQLQQGQRHFTLPEAAAMTGLSIDDTRHAMDVLLSWYVCRLQVSEHGDLIYHFGDTLQRRGEKTAAERRQELLNWLWKMFTVIYKVWITVTLVVYFVFFLVLMIVLLVAASSKRSSDGRRSAPVHLGGLANMFFSIFRWRTVTGAIDYQRDRAGYRYRHYEPRPAVLNDEKKSFIAAVYDFVFGPPRVELDPLTDEREVATYLLQNDGIIVTAELSALAGWNFPQAETFLTECAVRYRGEAKVSDNAVLYGQFDDLMRGVGEVETGEVTYYWHEYEPEYELTGNSAVYNLIIILMNGFNLLISFLVLSGSLTALFTSSHANAFLAFLALNPGFVKLVLGWVPFIFSLLFFLIPIVRGAKIVSLRRQRHQQNIRKRLFKAIFACQGHPQTVEEVRTAANTEAQEASLSRRVIETTLKELALDVPGDMTVSEAGEVQFAFPRITAELQAVGPLRQHRRRDDALGDIIVESDN